MSWRGVELSPLGTNQEDDHLLLPQTLALERRSQTVEVRGPEA